MSAAVMSAGVIACAAIALRWVLDAARAARAALEHQEA
jgi:hypothetical protein